MKTTKKSSGRYPQEIKTVHGNALLLGFDRDKKNALVCLKRKKEEITREKGAFFNIFIPVSELLTSEDGG